MKTTINAAIAITILTFSSIVGYNIATSNDNKFPDHYCTWEDCDHRGEEMDQWKFVSQWGYEEFTDGWCVEMTHFMDPQLSYEECEAYVFSGVE